MHRLFACGIVSLLLLAGCASPTRIRSAAIANTAPAEAIVALRQQEVKTTIERQNSSAIAGQFGLIGSLIGSSIDATVNSKREKAVESAASQLRNELLDYPPAEKLTAALRRQLAANGHTAPVEIVVRQVTKPGDPKEWVGRAGADVLLIDYDYALKPAYNGVHLSALVTWHRAGSGRSPTGPARSLPPAVYQNTLSSVRYFPPLAGTTLQEKAAELLADNAAVVRAALDLAQEDLAALLIYDLGIPERPENGLYKPGDSDIKRSLDVNAFSRVVLLGHIERTAGDRVWIRSITGDLGADQQ